jgi:hypothetical protein
MGEEHAFKALCLKKTQNNPPPANYRGITESPYRESVAYTRSSRLDEHLMHSFQKPPLLVHLQNRVPHSPCQTCDDVTMAPNNAPTPRESITLCSPPIPCCTTPPRLVVVNVVDAHHSTSHLYDSATAPKTMPHEGERHRKHHYRPIRDT